MHDQLAVRTGDRASDLLEQGEPRINIECVAFAPIHQRGH